MSTTADLTCYLLAAALCHVAAVYILPCIIMHVVMRKMRERLTAAAAGTALGGQNQSLAAARTLSETARCDVRGAFVFAHAPLPDHEARTIVCPSPDLLYSPVRFCVEQLRHSCLLKGLISSNFPPPHVSDLLRPLCRTSHSSLARGLRTNVFFSLVL